MEFPKGASIPFGQGRGQNPAREVASFIDKSARGSARRFGSELGDDDPCKQEKYYRWMPNSFSSYFAAKYFSFIKSYKGWLLTGALLGFL